MTAAPVGLPAPPPAPAQRRTSWEYKVLVLEQAPQGWVYQTLHGAWDDGQVTDLAGCGGNTTIADVLNHYGAQGWEVATALLSQKGATSFQYVLKRQAQ